MSRYSHKECIGDSCVPIPDYQSIMLPLLKLAADQDKHSLREAIDTLSIEFSLTDGEKEEILPSGKQAVFDNRVGWARTYLKKAGLVESPRRSFFKITSRGLEVFNRTLRQLMLDFSSSIRNLLNFNSTIEEPVLKLLMSKLWISQLITQKPLERI
ncbi:Mrr restriction system protein [uncultured Synechococcales cyanobacterium]|uniref:Mrr restriction system protein n=1 Tax=uncultured Synechococcales cyanobacterium TaxID=1936017 RepID=A0A6J4UIM2_9CYAN|nr:Mrr restriction system protein [uncultured Synechococcales cyanobacterium]